jgi:mannose-6-phosphate isomerase-like protein (cupin superfamily)
MKESRKIRRLAGGLIIGVLVVQIDLLAQAAVQNVAPPNAATAAQPAAVSDSLADCRPACGLESPKAAKNVGDLTAVVQRDGIRRSQPEATARLTASQPGSASESTNPAKAAVPPSPDGVRYFPSPDVHAAFEKGSPLITKDGHTYSVSAGRRDKPGSSELHEKDTDVFYVLQGSATFVTGGKMVDPKTTAPGEIRGSAIEGGEIRTLSKDDVIVIPAGVPHWFKDVQGLFLYFVVKVQ